MDRASPTIADSKTEDGSGIGTYTSELTGLEPNTTYYVRAYATNDLGTAYGQTNSFKTPDYTGTFTDGRDSIQYQYVTIGSQVWMAENLKYLPSVMSYDTESETIPCYYVYGYSVTDVSIAKATSSYQTYGVLYNWPAAMAGSASNSSNPSGVQGVCPSGWHLPSDAEWTELTDNLGGISVAGGKLKENGTTHWSQPNEATTNETGFTALPGGYRYHEGQYMGRRIFGVWWSSTESNTSNARTRSMSINNHIDIDEVTKEYGFSVRCLKD